MMKRCPLRRAVHETDLHQHDYKEVDMEFLLETHEDSPESTLNPFPPL